jgi:hypothetical protein
MGPVPHTRSALLFIGALCALALLLPPAARATPYDYLPVGDPLEAELRILDLYDSRTLQDRIRLPHLGIRPLQLIELQGVGNPPADVPPALAISLARLERALGRDRGPSFAPHPTYRSTPRLLDHGTGAQLFQVSVGVEGAGVATADSSRLLTGSGLHGRIALELERFLIYSHYVVGRFDEARRFADPIIPENDLIVLPEEIYLAYADVAGRWGAQFGRGRWQFGPGEEGSLTLSKTSPLLTGLAFRVRLASLRVDAIAISATLEQAAGEQLAAHRLEWQPFDALRVGVTEAARYQADGWKPLYLMGAIPYVIVQRLERQYEVDSLRSVRNNVIIGTDATLRLWEGTRIYGEILIDDIHAKSGSLPNKFGFQLGMDGASSLLLGRLSWGGEFTRITRYVYTSFFGRDHEVDGRSLGFPTGPDVRRLRLRLGWDPGADWGLTLRATHTDKGENDIDEPFIPRSPRVNSSILEGVIETTREAELGLAWWPASGVRIAVSGSHRWIENPGHVADTDAGVTTGAIELRLTR